MSPMCNLKRSPDGHLIGRPKTKPSVFFSRGFARVEHTFLEKVSLVRSYVFCSHGFSGLQDLLSIELSYERKATLENFRMVVLSAVPNSNRNFGEFAIEGFNRSHRGTEVISPAAGKSFACRGSRVTLSSLRALLPNLK
jgi:hypothetical protein